MEVLHANLDPYMLSSRSCVFETDQFHNFHTTCHISEFCMKLETDICDKEVTYTKHTSANLRQTQRNQTQTGNHAMSTGNA